MNVTDIGSKFVLRGIVGCLISALIASNYLMADEDPYRFFEARVRPLLIQHCYSCHSQEAEKSKGGLLLDSQAGWRQGGDSGPALVPEKPEESLLLRAVGYDDPDLQMPPDGRLSAAEIQTLKIWIEAGAPDPRQTASAPQTPEPAIDLDEGRRYWAFQQPVFPAFPPVRHREWPLNGIDQLVLSRLEANAIPPPPVPAVDNDLIRRIYFDLNGLPPSPEQLSQFRNSAPETAWGELVDRLLASERFGETWGRHWLDLARYSESTGGGRSALLPDAWRYRNYVVESFNRDKPFNRFVREQIAGDLLPYQNPTQRAEQLIATAFLVLGPKNLDLQDKELLRMNTVDEQIDTVSRVFMGITVSCARCHDHKFDPILARDYYALAGIFRSTKTLKRSNVSTLTKVELPVPAAERERFARYDRSVKQIEAEIRKAKKLTQTEAVKQQLAELETKRRQLRQNPVPPLPQTLGVVDEPDPDDYFLCVRGNVHQLDEPVPRGFIRTMMAADTPDPVIAEKESGRRELADWLSNERHPLVARVWVNRVWHHLFGRGIVATVDNFGTRGSLPSHPELLDYLAVQFVRDGWSTKSLVRRIVNSRTYQARVALDPATSLSPRRLTAEALRDAILSISGDLVHRQVDCLFPAAVRNDQALQKADLDVDALLSVPLRSVYLPVLREEGLHPLLQAFDFANPSFTVGSRHQSVLPTQALYLMNSEFVMAQADRSARTLLAENPRTNPADLLELAWLKTLSRKPHPEEKESALAFMAQSELAPAETWSRIFHSLFASIDFRFLK